MDVALLGLDVTSQPIKKATDRNKDFSRSAKGAERSAGSLERASRGLSGTMGALARATVPLVAGLVSFQAVANSIGSARQFNSAMAEASTLIAGTAEELAFLEDQARSMSRTFGGSATEQVKGFYQALSAGAGSVEEAAQVLDAANRFAIGGVASVTVGVDALTTATNAYAASGLTAAQASDALFVGIVAGKTTATELAASLGQIVPIASSVGVSFDEVVAGISALTTQGQSTAMATTGLRQVLASIISPTSQAAEMADKLGISFDTQALKSKGLAGFLQEVTEKTGGNQTAMADLFGSVEALNAVLAFSGAAGGTLVKILEDMEAKAGSTSTAFEKMAGSLENRLMVQVATFRDAALSLGTTILEVAVPAMEAFTSHAGLATVAFAALGTAIAVAGGPITLVLGALAASVTAFGIWKKNAEVAETASIDAAIANGALIATLDVFYNTSAPEAGRAAIELANDHVKLAGAALDAAEAHVALLKAEMATVTARTDLQPGNFFREDEKRIILEDLAIATTELAEAEATLAFARANQKTTAGAITGSDFNVPGVPIIEIPDIPGLGGADTINANFEQRLEALQSGLMTEREFVDEWYAEAQQVLADQRSQEILGEEAHKQALLQVEQSYQEQVAAIGEQNRSRQLSEMADFFGAAAQVAQQGGSGLIRAAKTLGAVEATINAYRAATQALADPTVGFWGKAAAYASVLATGLGAAKAISGSGSGGSSGGGGGGSYSSNTQAAPQQPPQRVFLEGIDKNSLFTGQQMSDLFDRFYKENKNRGTVFYVR